MTTRTVPLLPVIHRLRLEAAASAVIVLALAPLSSNCARASTAVPLPGTTVEIPYETFRATVERPPDTVYRATDKPPPVPLVLDRAAMGLRLADSSVTCTLSVTYSVLQARGWCSALIFGEGASCVFTDVSLPTGDFLVATDSGIVVLAAASPQRAPRSLRCIWTVPAGLESGLRSAQVAMPRAVRGTLQVVARPALTDITIEGAALLATRQSTGQTVRTFSVPAGGGTLGVSYAAPLPVAAAKSTAAIPEEPGGRKEPKVSVTQETALFLSEEGGLALSAIHLGVTVAPITAFALTLPRGYSLLSVDGNGIRSYEPAGDTLLRVHLTYDLEGDYVLYLVAEVKCDTLASVPCPVVVGAARQSGRFAVGMQGAGEAQFVLMRQCIGTPVSAFIAELSPGLADLITQHKKDVSDLLLAGTFYRTPFDAALRLQRHAAAAVADAIADSGSIASVISSDWKMMTQATWWVRQSSRQLLNLGLPDSADLWSVSINGAEATPFRTERGEYKVSLQRFLATDGGRTRLELTCTYYQDLSRSRRGGRVNLVPSVPDIPVASLTWSVFYPRNWSAQCVRGDFVTSISSLLGSRRLQLQGDEKASRYDKLVQSQKARQEQQGGAPGVQLPLMPASPRHLLAHRILVVGEKPVLRVTFMAGWMVALGSLLVWCVALAVAVALALRAAKRWPATRYASCVQRVRGPLLAILRAHTRASCRPSP
jgi:hypothetical protein